MFKELVCVCVCVCVCVRACVRACMRVAGCRRLKRLCRMSRATFFHGVSALWTQVLSFCLPVCVCLPLCACLFLCRCLSPCLCLSLCLCLVLRLDRRVQELDFIVFLPCERATIGGLKVHGGAEGRKWRSKTERGGNRGGRGGWRERASDREGGREALRPHDTISN